MPEKINAKSADITQINYQRLVDLLSEHFPSCVQEHQVEMTAAPAASAASLSSTASARSINWQMLSTLIGTPLSAASSSAENLGRELVGFSFSGKREAVREAVLAVDMSLRPLKEESLNWDNTGNLYIKGDNLNALKLLQNSYLGKVKMIYIDPPYNTGKKNFVYKDNFTQDAVTYAQESGQIDPVTGARLVSNPETSPRFHSVWCSMIYARLLLARSLLRADGLIFISIDDHELHHLRDICDEIFGEQNFIACFPRVTKRSGKSTETVSSNHDYVLLYAKSAQAQLERELQDTSDFKFEDEFVHERGRYKLNQTLDYDSLGYNSSLDYPIEIQGQVFYPGGDAKAYAERQKGHHANRDWAWRWSKSKFAFGLKHGFIVVKNKRLYTKTYEWAKIEKNPALTDTEPYVLLYGKRQRTPTSLDYVDNAFSNDNAKKGLKALFGGDSVFEYSKPLSLLQSLVRLATKAYSHDVVLDFFSGSATTAEAVMQVNAEDGGNRRFILVQLPEECEKQSPAFQAGFDNICQIGIERMSRAAKQICTKIAQNYCTKIVLMEGKRDFYAVLSELKGVNKAAFAIENRSVEHSAASKEGSTRLLNEDSVAIPLLAPLYASVLAAKDSRSKLITGSGDSVEATAATAAAAAADVSVDTRVDAHIEPVQSTDDDGKLLPALVATIKESLGLDFGFRVFAVDSSNFTESFFDASVMSQSMLSLLEGNIKSDRNDLDLLFACVLAGKLPLSCPYSEELIAGHKVYSYNHGQLLACFEQEVGEELVHALAGMALHTAYMVLRDSCFSSSSDKINLSELFKTLLPEVELRVL